MKKCLLLLMALTLFAKAYTQEDSIALISSSTLLFFQVQNVDKVVMLKWALETSEDFKSFDIERADEGGQFIKVGSKLAISKTGDSGYDFVDATPLRNTNLRYRLKFIGKDGVVSYSEAMPARVTEGQLLVRLKNNPVRNNIELELTSLSAKQASVAVVSSTGQQMAAQTFRLTAGVNQLSLSGQSLQQGIYQLIVEAGAERKVISLVKE